LQPIPLASGSSSTPLTPKEPLSPPPRTPNYPGAPGETPYKSSAAERESPFGQPAKPNPFADAQWPLNPYSAPAYSGAFQAPAREAAYAQSKVQGPAIALLVTYGIALAVYSVALAMFVYRAIQGNAAPEEFFQFVLSVPLSIFVLYGANKMRRLEQHGLATAAAVCAMVPCTVCCVLGVPFGIWALSVLNDPYVRAAFRS
jgi:hypothetical protein